MAEILVTHPGKLGDLVWAAATMKAIAGRGKVDLAVSTYCAPLVPLLQHQAWIEDVFVHHGWEIAFTAPVSPWEAPPLPGQRPPPLHQTGVWGTVYHLGMREWPSPTLYQYYLKLMAQEYGRGIVVKRNEPWLTVPKSMGPAPTGYIALCFTDEWKELKAGLTFAIAERWPGRVVRLVDPASKMNSIFPHVAYGYLKKHQACNLLNLAWWLSHAKLVVTCNSLPHPLANALGKHCVVVEPSVPRQQAVFKREHPRNTYVDGFDVEEVLSVIERVWEEVQ